MFLDVSCCVESEYDFKFNYYNFSIFEMHLKNVQAWPEKICGQGHFDQNAPGRFEAMSLTCPMTCPVFSIFFMPGQARPSPTKVSFLTSQSFKKWKLILCYRIE